MSRRAKLGESLIESGLITPAQLDEALKRGNATGERLGEALVGLGYISERDLLRTLAADADIPFLAPRELVGAMGNPFDVGVIRSLERTTGRHIRVFAADPAAIAQLVENVYGGGAQ